METKLLVIKHLRDGGLVLDENDRLLFVKGHPLELGSEPERANILRKLSDHGYDRQFDVIPVAKPIKYANIKKTIKKWAQKLFRQ